MKIIISIVAVMFYAVIGCFISEMGDEEYNPLYILFWPIVIACFIPIWIVSGILKGFGWLSRKLRKHKSMYAHIDQNIEYRWDDSGSPYDQLLKAKQRIEGIKDIANIEDKITRPFYELLAGTEDDLKVAEYMLDKERRALLITMMNTVGRLSPDVECLVEEWVANKKALDERMSMIKCKDNTTDTEEGGDHI